MANILIAEDEHTLNEAYQMILKSEGHTVYPAYDGLEALKIAAKHPPDLILLDLKMPHLDGIEFLRKYDPVKNHPNVKVIIFSNLDMEREIDKAYDLGAHKYVLKAWASPKELIRMVDEILKQSNATSHP